MVREKGDNVLMAFPSKPSAGPEMVIARTGGHSQNTDYLLLQPEPCLLYTSPSPRDKRQSRMPSSA